MNILRYESTPFKNKRFNVHWRIGNYCNYHCSYCQPVFNKGPVSSFVPLGIAKATINNVIDQRSDKDIGFFFTGGEPTVHPQFLDLLESVGSKEARASLITNGSRSVNYYKRLATVLSGVIYFTFHAEYAVKNKFLDNLILFPKNRIIIFIPMNPNHWNTCVDLFEQLILEGYNVVPKVMLDDFGISGEAKKTNYSAEQESYMQQANKQAAAVVSLAKWTNNSQTVYSKFTFRNKNAIVAKSNLVDLTLEDGSHVDYTMHQLVLNKLTYLKGMQCNAGIESAYINHRGQVFKATCRQDGMIGNIYADTNFKLPTESTTCSVHNCWCTDDLQITKWVTNTKIKKVIPIEVLNENCLTLP